MNIAIIGSKAFDSLEFHLHEAFTYAQHNCKIFDVADRWFMHNKYGVQADFIMRRYSDAYDRHIFKNIAKQVTQFKPQLVIATYRFIHPEFVSLVKKHTNSTVIHVNPDAMTTLEYQQIFASDYDAWFTKDPYILRFMKNNMKLNAYHYNEAFNPRIHTKPQITKKQAEQKIHTDVITYGTIYPYRARMLRQVIKHNIQLKIYGTRPNRFYDHYLDKAYQKQYITGKEKTQILYGAKIVLNQMHFAEIESVNNRFFEANGAGAFQLSDYRPILHQLLPIQPELVSFHNIDEAIEKIHYYLQHPQERYQIAHKIYQHFLNNYTYDHLIQYILKNTLHT